MKAHLKCIPCLLKTALSVACNSSKDDAVRHRIMTDVLRMMTDMDFTQPPPYTAWRAFEIAARHTGGVDAYIQQKDRSTELAWALLRQLDEIAGYNADSFESKVRLAVAGNILDFSVFCDLDLDEARKSISEAFEKPIDVDGIQRLQGLMERSTNILYLLDNAGEAVFDRVLLEPYRDKITLGVRAMPSSNDMTRRELEASGLENFARMVVDNGTNLPGVIPQFAGPEMQAALSAADLVIAKGQGNFECLNETTYPLAFLFMAKCPVVCSEINAPMRSLQVRLQYC